MSGWMKDDSLMRLKRCLPVAVLCALVLSFIGGGLIGWSFTGWTATSMRAGMAVTLSIPWKLIGGGAAFALSLCLVMSVLPLAWITRREE